MSLVLLIALLAGCAGTPPKGEAGEDISTDQSQPQETDPIAPAQDVLAPLDQVLRFDGCTGVSAFAPVPSEVLGVQPPAGWEGSNTGIAEIHNDAYLCDRVSIDRFERGPVGLMFEFTAVNGGPASCKEGEWYSQEGLYAIWVTDPEIAAHLANLGLNARTLAIARTEETTGPLRQVHWTLEGDGFTGSLETRNTSESARLVTPNVVRFFWTNLQGGISFMNLATEVESDSQGIPAVTGSMPEPFLFGRTGVEPYGGYGAGLVNSHGSGEIYSFRDLECKEPL